MGPIETEDRALVKASSIENAFDRLNKTIETTLGTARVLEDRLQSVLSHETAGAEKDGPEKLSAHSVRNRLSNAADDVDQIFAILQRISNELEL